MAFLLSLGVSVDELMLAWGDETVDGSDRAPVCKGCLVEVNLLLPSVDASTDVVAPA